MNFSLSATAAAALVAQAGEPVLSSASQPMGGAVHEEGEPMQVGDFNAWAFFAWQKAHARPGACRVARGLASPNLFCGTPTPLGENGKL